MNAPFILQILLLHYCVPWPSRHWLTPPAWHTLFSWDVFCLFTGLSLFLPILYPWGLGHTAQVLSNICWTEDFKKVVVFVQSLSPVSFWLQELQHSGFPVLQYCPEFVQTCPLNQWCHPTISPYVIPFLCPQSFPALGPFPVSWLFTSGGQSIEALASVLPMNVQDWFPLG